MDLISLAISILWLLIGVIVILGIVWLAFYVVKLFVPVPAPIEKAAWAIVLLLVLIAALSMFVGGGKGFKGFSLKSTLSTPYAVAISTPTINYST